MRGMNGSTPARLRQCSWALAALACVTTEVTAQVTAELVTSALDDPLQVLSPPGDARLFVVQQGGRIRILSNDVLLPTPYYDASPHVAAGGYTGLRALCFHPDYANNGFAYVAYDTVSSGAGDVVVDRLTVSADPNVLDPASRVEVLRFTQEAAWHGGGNMHFGPDGYLYVAFGDGYGLGGDPNCNAQDGLKINGKILRIDVDAGAPYGIPAGNPYVGDANTLDEVWHRGLRHPWRWSFDRLTGDMWIADVGQSAQEEVNFVPAGSSGHNFGWSVMEGTSCFNGSQCTQQLPCNSPQYTDPIHVLNTSPHCSITGGFVYRGSACSSEYGKYFFGDWCTGDVWSLEYDGNTVSGVTSRNADLGVVFNGLTSLGEDANGELYFVQGGSGRLWRMVPECGSTSYCTANANSSGNTAQISSTGTPSVAANDFGLSCVGAVPNRPGLFFYGPSQISAPFGEGVRCVGGSLYRLQPPVVTGPLGDAVRSVDFTQPPANAGSGAISPGSTWNFQFWYRDPAGGPGGFNLSNGVSTLFCP